MRRRGLGRQRPSLLGTAARTAVVAGTANAVVTGSAARRQAAASHQQATIDAAVAQQLAASQPPPMAAAPAAAATPGALTDDAITRLKQLADLRDAGVLSEEEFAAQKSLLLG